METWDNDFSVKKDKERLNQLRNDVYALLNTHPDDWEQIRELLGFEFIDVLNELMNMSVQSDADVYALLELKGRLKQIRKTLNLKANLTKRLQPEVKNGTKSGTT